MDHDFVYRENIPSTFPWTFEDIYQGKWLNDYFNPRD